MRVLNQQDQDETDVNGTGLGVPGKPFIHNQFIPANPRVGCLFRQFVYTRMNVQIGTGANTRELCTVVRATLFE